MHPRNLLPLSHSTARLLAFAALLGACAGSKGHEANQCLDRCTSLSALERSTCELECQQLATRSQTTPAPAPAPQPVATTPPPQPTPTATAPQPTPARPSPTPTTTPQPTPTTPQPVVIHRPAPGPSMAELQRQRAACESSCENETAASDRSTCRLQCAQITNQPSSSTVPPQPYPTTTTTPNTSDPAAIARCQQGCNDAGGSDTDRATCRLNCSAVGTVGPPPSTQIVVHGSAPTGGTSRSDVIRSSGNVVAPDQQKIAQCAAVFQQCNAGCDTQMAPCTAECDRTNQKPTDKATCKLTCESTVDVCRDDCRVREGRCRGG